MHFMKRTLLSIIRRPIKSIIILFIMLSVATILVSVSAIERGASKEKDDFLNSGKLGFNLRNNPEYLALGPRGQGSIDAKTIEKIQQIDGVSGANKRSAKIVQLANANTIKIANNEFDAETERLYGQVTNIYGVDDSSLDISFSIETLKLTQGRHITPEDRNKILVHEELARINKLSLGSIIKVKPINHPDENPYQSSNEVELEVVGVFTSNNQQMATSNMELPENTLFTDNNSLLEVLSIPQDQMTYQDATFFSKDKASYDSALKEVRKLPIDWNVFEIHETSEYTMGLTGTLDNISKIISSIKIFAILLSIGLLLIISFIWLTDRKKEMGTLYSLGIKKINICGQLVTEFLLISVIALSLSYFSGNAVAENLGNTLTSVAAENATKEIRKDFQTQLGADIQTATLTKTPDKIDIESSPKDILKVGSYIIVIVLVSQAIILIPLMRKNAKELLVE